MLKWSTVLAAVSFTAWSGMAAAQTAPATAPAAPNPHIEENVIGSVAGLEGVKGVVMSSDASRIALVAVKAKQQYVIIDGKTSPPYDWVIPESLEFSYDGKHTAYLIQSATD